MNKAASMVAIVLAGALATGCGSQGTQANVHVKVFEVPTQALRLHTGDQNPRKLSNSAYVLSVVTPDDLDALLGAGGTNQRLLTERTRVISDWPAVADTWVYSSSYTGMPLDRIYSGSGGGVGSLGVRERGHNLEVRLDYMISHSGPQGERLIESQIFYEHSYPEGHVLLFHTPSNEKDGSPRRHVIAFEITRDDHRSPFEASDSQRPSPQIFGYR